MFTRKPRLQLEKFAINGAKRLLQHNLPCVDGSELARAFFRFAALVGAAMCSAFRCGSHDRVPRFNSGRGLQYLAHVPPPMSPH